MKEISIKKLRQNIFNELKLLPICVVRDGVPYSVVLSHKEYKRLVGVPQKDEKNQGVVGGVPQNIPEDDKPMEKGVHLAKYGVIRERLGYFAERSDRLFYPGREVCGVGKSGWVFGLDRKSIDPAKWKQVGY